MGAPIRLGSLYMRDSLTGTQVAWAHIWFCRRIYFDYVDRKPVRLSRLLQRIEADELLFSQLLVELQEIMLKAMLFYSRTSAVHKQAAHFAGLLAPQHGCLPEEP